MARPMTLQQQFEAGVAHHRAGRFAEAERIYRQVLAQQPDHAEALNQLGALARRSRRLDAAVELIRRAIQLQPDLAPAHCNLGNALIDKGQFDEAIAACRRAIALRPNYAEAHGILANALRDNGQLDEAIAAFRQAIAVRPDYAEAHNNLGGVLEDKGRRDEAIASYRQAIRFKPDLAEAHYNLGNALGDGAQLDEAIASYHQAIRLNADYAQAHNNLGNALKAKGQADEAIASYRQAIWLKPDFAEAHNNLGITLTEKGEPDEAIAACRRAIALNPKLPQAHRNLGNALRDKGQLDEAVAACRRAIGLGPNCAEAYNDLGAALACKGQFDQAIAAFRQAIALKPSYAEARANIALSLLTQGDFQQGWEEYEWRDKRMDALRGRRRFDQPQWDGRTLEGRIILLHTEQGLGDAIQFIRYVPLVQQRGGRVIVECQGELQRLFQTMAGERQIVVRGQPLPAFDLHCPLLSLPRVFGTNLANIPNVVPYLRADAGCSTRWQDRLASQTGLLKIGLAWVGSPTYKNDRNRSTKLERLAPLGQVAGARFFSLQKGAAAAEATTPPPGLELIDWTEELRDFADSAALIANLDLVVAVDTAVAHLAGAMGKAVWTLLPLAPDWRWMLQRQDSPWYPTMRLFRQDSFGDWDGVIAKVTEALGHIPRQSKF